jgi:hypothetical protein
METLFSNYNAYRSKHVFYLTFYEQNSVFDWCFLHLFITLWVYRKFTCEYMTQFLLLWISYLDEKQKKHFICKYNIHNHDENMKKLLSFLRSLLNFLWKLKKLRYDRLKKNHKDSILIFQTLWIIGCLVSVHIYGRISSYIYIYICT